MGKLFDEIRKAIEAERVIVGDHADERMREREIELWQVVAEIDEADLLEERPKDQPNPSVVFRADVGGWDGGASGLVLD